MKRLVLMVLTVTVSASFASAQVRSTHATSTTNETSASTKGRDVNLASNTSLAAQLESSLDARHAKVGDRVVLKTIEAVKQNGDTVVPKGARLLGHVTEVQQSTRENSESRLGVTFDRLQKGALDMPITATIVSITQAQTHESVGDSSLDSGTMASSSGRMSSSGSQRSGGGGGLLGGAGNTVGGVVNTTTSTVGNVAGTTTSAAGSTVGATTNTAGNLTGSLRGLQITQSSSASADGGSTLSLGTGNLKLESGTTFHLLVSTSTSAGTPQ